MQTSQDRSKIKQKRIMTYFIKAANEIIKQEGIGAVTIRKAADIAGYASATLYNYFDNLPHLVFLATMHYLGEYHAALPRYLAGCKNSVERYMAICQCFTEFSLDEPEIYKLLFFTHGDEKLEEYTRQYYELFPEKIKKDWPAPLDKIFNINNIYRRSAIMLDDCVNEGFLSRESADAFNDIALMVSKCILQDFQDGLLDKDTALKKTMDYYHHLLGSYLDPAHRNLMPDLESLKRPQVTPGEVELAAQA
ncbi:AcrR family transcriptional regulator [Desulfobaculum xiamenense]|uniref:AcrR family transcriptional regulator n=1 Tax=Desulfobaculum xiamenense TaxID=995050 RepID=A0A846QNW5_9BACT|nr:TetR/AcrR family transcriptional regulator [Desulfobaculum xiamenense]NJB66399.1 AcrR family transcriptional regulator [Desulfobaculum xiamenense]